MLYNLYFIIEIDNPQIHVDPLNWDGDSTCVPMH
jgi:hypothetical protein